MWEKITDVAESIVSSPSSMMILTLVFGGVLVFTGLFNVTAPKGEVISAKTVWWIPTSIGMLLVVTGLALYIFKSPASPIEPEKQLSRGLIFVLRHLDALGDFRPAYFFGRALHAFNAPRKEPQTYETAQPGWEKASEYAVRILVILGFATQEGSRDFRISEEGRNLLKSDAVRAKFTDAFSRKLVDLTV